MAQLGDLTAGMKTEGWNANNLIYTDYITLVTESKENSEEFTVKIEMQSETSSLILNIERERNTVFSSVLELQNIDSVLGKWRGD